MGAVDNGRVGAPFFALLVAGATWLVVTRTPRLAPGIKLQIMGVPTLLITGPPGVGKTTIGGAISAALRDPPVPHAFIDIDALAWCFPPPPSDRFQQRLALRNLRAVWLNCRTAGATHLILARVVESRAEIDDYRRAIPDAEIQLVRLRACLTTLEERIKHRRVRQDQTWHLTRAAELGPVMDETCVEDHLVETDERSPSEIAAEILAKCRWRRSDA